MQRTSCLLLSMVVLGGVMSLASGASQSLLPRDKFVIFAREEGSGGWNDMTSVAWELDLSGSEPVFERKHVFGKSSWAPMLFFWNSAPSMKSFVRIQLDDSHQPNHYRARLYKIDYADWSAKLILEGGTLPI